MYISYTWIRRLEVLLFRHLLRGFPLSSGCGLFLSRGKNTASLLYLPLSASRDGLSRGQEAGAPGLKPVAKHMQGDTWGCDGHEELCVILQFKAFKREI